MQSRQILLSTFKALIWALVVVCVAAVTALAQSTFQPVPRFAFSRSSIAIEQLAEPQRPFTVAGEAGAIFGKQDGAFELWQFPVKVLNRFHLVAELAGHPVPIDLNQQAGWIEVSPDHTTITYSHPAIVVKQHMFAVRGPADKTAGAIVLFEIASTRPATLTFQCEAAMMNQWPAPSYGRPSAAWFDLGDGGGYLLSNDKPGFIGAVAMPRARPGTPAPHQERPKPYPLEFKVAFDPKKDSTLFFPFVAVVSRGAGADQRQAVQQQLSRTVASIPELYRSTIQYYGHFFDDKLTAETPDRNFDAALRWAEVSIDQARVQRGDETGLVAGWSTSGDSARPGFGWFFGRDTLWSAYAIHSYGDFALARDAISFLIRRQRSDGKIMHEYSQTADLVNWSSLPYEFAAADSTPLFVMVMEDYVRSSGDVGFLRLYWPNVKLAYQFTRKHDSDGDGIYDNSEGTGWVESWPPAMPHQELYLASLDQQSSEAISRLAVIMGDQNLSAAAAKQASLIRTRLAGYRDRDGFYAFSRNADGTYDTTPTIFPAVAWWTGRLLLPDADDTFSRWASQDFSTDWGTRAVSQSSPTYDPVAYHQGSVWPLFTGWTAMAEYRTDQSLSAYAHLMANADLTWTQDLGAVTEVLSGQFFEPLEHSSSHQLWSSAMVLSPAIRGLFGIEADVLHGNLRVYPSLPATWDHVVIHKVPFGNDRLELAMERHAENMIVTARSTRATTLCLIGSATPVNTACREAPSRDHRVSVPLPPVEVSLMEHSPSPGAETSQLKVVRQHYGSNRLMLNLQAPAGTAHKLRLRVNANGRHVSVSGAQSNRDVITVIFPPGNGYTSNAVEIRW